jgi:uncharacterized protein
MKNMKISIDMLWLDARGAVVHVEAAVPPCEAEPCPSYRPLKAARYVLELPAGDAARLGLAPGAHVMLENIEPPPPPRRRR